MSRSRPRTVLPRALALSLAVAAAATAPAQDADGFRWHDDLTAARVAADAAQKPLFVLFRCER